MIKRKDVGRALHELREMEKMSMDDLTEKSGLKRNQIIALEKGQTNYTIDNLIRFWNGLGIDEVSFRRYRDDNIISDSLADLLTDTVKIKRNDNKV